jgi:hypothetical protein
VEETVVEKAVPLDEALVETKDHEADAAADERSNDRTVRPGIGATAPLCALVSGASVKAERRHAR